MPRPSAWNSPTTAVRIPQHAVNAVLSLCRQLDQTAPSGFVQNPSPPVLVTIEGNTKTDRYLLQPVQLTPEEERTIEGAIAWLDEQLDLLKPDERILLFARLVEATMQPFESQVHQ